MARIIPCLSWMFQTVQFESKQTVMSIKTFPPSLLPLQLYFLLENIIWSNVTLEVLSQKNLSPHFIFSSFWSSAKLQSKLKSHEWGWQKVSVDPCILHKHFIVERHFLCESRWVVLSEISSFMSIVCSLSASCDIVVNFPSYLTQKRLNVSIYLHLYKYWPNTDYKSYKTLMLSQPVLVIRRNWKIKLMYLVTRRTSLSGKIS